MGRNHHLKGGYSSSWVRPTTRVAYYLRDGLCCVYCLQDWSVDGLTLDHVRSRSQGGGNQATNVVSACMRCNGLKRVLELDEFARRLGMTLEELLSYLAEQARPLTRHLRRRARHLCRFPPPWLRQLRELNKNWSPQISLFPPPARILPMVHVEQPVEGLEDEPGAPEDDHDIPF